MPGLKDPTEAGMSGEQKGPLVERDWRYAEHNITQARERGSVTRSFKGASSMMDVSESPKGADTNSASTSEQNLQKLLRDLEGFKRTNHPSTQEEFGSGPAYLSRFLERARAHFENQDFEACLKVLQESLKLAPGNPEILSLVEKAREKCAIQRAEPDLADRIAKFKTEAIDLFQQGKYSECVARFKLLHELEPANCDLRHYLEISQEQVQQQQSHLNSIGTPPSTDPDTETTEAPAPDVPTLALPSPNEPLPQVVSVEPQRPSIPVVSAAEPILPLPLTQRDSIAEVIPEFASKSPAGTPVFPSSNHPVVSQSEDLTLVRKEAESEIALDEVSGTPEATAQLSQKKLKIAYLTGVGLVIGAVLGMWLALGPTRRLSLQEDQSLGNKDTVEEEPKDQVQLNNDSTSSAKEDPQTLAQKSFKQGKLVEASRYCDTILEKDPDNRNALHLRQEIRERFSNLGSQAMANQRWEEARSVWSNLLRAFPNDREAVRQLSVARINLKKQEQMASATKLELQKKVHDLHQQISQAFSSGNYLPPSSGNAMDLVQQLDTLSPNDSFGREKLDQIFRELTAQANRALQAKDHAHASTLIRQIQTYFPEAPELRVLRDRIKAEEARVAEARSSWMQRVESAIAAGRFVTPPNDNAVAYCNQLLLLEPQNPKALGLKKESAAKAVAQAKTLVQEGRYDDARADYSSLLYLSQNESQLPLNAQELKTEMERLAFSAYAVVHDHAIGSCTGRLRFNAYQIAFIPSTDLKDGFTSKISEIEKLEPGDKLKILLKGKTYRFQANSTKNAQENHAKIGDIYQRLSTLLASNK